ncbi:hypothetical protein CEP54_016359 [Fusarium duplospermum]|uniref:Uncharacterized protein n=1 Tax=Fusarium duplospermum TaxID=1325734 RepID=A0A428NEL1_9HYPO|nr:hypothetical protein CEP54_016359 [Fusarium duplospermum]
MQASSTSQDIQPGASTTRTRVAYIRTVLDDEVEYYEYDWRNLTTWLCFWVGQQVPKDPFGNEHRRQSQPPPDIRHHYILRHHNAADTFVLEWLLRNSDMKIGIDVVSSLESTEYASDDICDAVMLSRSDYILETSLVRGAGCSTTFDTLFRNSMRHGRPQQYNAEEKSSAYYANRLKSKMGHTKRYSM